MATKVHHLEALNGLDGMQSLMMLLTNPSKYDSAFKELIKIREEVRKLIELIGPADEIPTLRGAARYALEQARVEAEAIVKKSVEKTDRVQKKLDSDVAAFEKRVTEANASMSSKAERIEADRQALLILGRAVSADRKDLDSRLERLALDEKIAAGLKADYTERLRRFKEATSE